MFKKLFDFGKKNSEIKENEIAETIDTDNEDVEEETYDEELISDEIIDKEKQLILKEVNLEKESSATLSEKVENLDENSSINTDSNFFENENKQSGQVIKKIEDLEKTYFEEDNEEKLGFFARIKKGLDKTSQNFSKKINDLFTGYTKIDDEIFEELEELLILGDLGFETSVAITEELKTRAKSKKIEDVNLLHEELENIIKEILLDAERENQSDGKYPRIMVIVGVNGVGKTTSIGKISMQLKSSGRSVMLAAGDTFRAAAAEQLGIWAERSGVPIVRSNEGADPSSVIFDAIKSAKSKNIDVLICDTAGRLHNKKNLMIELEKIFRIVRREYPEAEKDIFLVIDATTGQNAVNQAKIFSEVAQINGIILTKLDGTAKGGVVITLAKELKIPIRYVGVGEKINDLQKFEAESFVKALFLRNNQR